jgi:hypothetical protein
MVRVKPDYFYRCGTQLEMKEALADCLRSQITFGSTAVCDIDETVAEGTRRISKLAETLGKQVHRSVRAEWRAANDALRSLRFSPAQVYCR